jgi:hypothetical protein
VTLFLTCSPLLIMDFILSTFLYVLCSKSLGFQFCLFLNNDYATWVCYIFIFKFKCLCFLAFLFWIFFLQLKNLISAAVCLKISYLIYVHICATSFQL